MCSAPIIPIERGLIVSVEVRGTHITMEANNPQSRSPQQSHDDPHPCPRHVIIRYNMMQLQFISISAFSMCSLSGHRYAIYPAVKVIWSRRILETAVSRLAQIGRQRSAISAVWSKAATQSPIGISLPQQTGVTDVVFRPGTFCGVRRVPEITSKPPVASIS